jgi:hypothetical protein
VVAEVRGGNGSSKNASRIANGSKSNDKDKSDVVTIAAMMVAMRSG